MTITTLISISLLAVNAQEQTIVTTTEGSAEKVEKKTESVKKHQSSDDSWTGFYVGGFGGYTNGRATPQISTINGSAIGVEFVLVNQTASQRLKSNGFTGGGTFGYNFQKGRFLVGAEFDFGGQKFDKSVSSTATFTNGRPFTITQLVKSDWLLTARPRLGVASKKMFFYVTGGLAVTNIKYNGDYLLLYPSEPNFKDTESSSFSKTKAGWTVGTGIEFKVAKHWSVKAEYLFNQLGRTSVISNNYTSISPGGSASTSNQPYTHSTDLKSHSIRFGVNYRF